MKAMVWEIRYHKRKHETSCVKFALQSQTWLHYSFSAALQILRNVMHVMQCYLKHFDDQIIVIRWVLICSDSLNTKNNMCNSNYHHTISINFALQYLLIFELCNANVMQIVQENFWRENRSVNLSGWFIRIDLWKKKYRFRVRIFQKKLLKWAQSIFLHYSVQHL